MAACDRRLVTIVALAVLIALPTAAAASQTFEGTITVGHPATGVGVGVTELAAACDPGSDLNGVDGHWYEVSTYASGTFVLTMAETLDADVWFYDANCTLIDHGEGAQGILGVTEIGTVPADADHAIVNGYMGTGSFVLTLET